MITASLALLVDSVRELRAKKLFWFVLAISALIVIGYGSIGFNDQGVSIAYGIWTIESDELTADSPWSKVFLEGLFAYFIVSLWLAWGATILALVSTAGVFPDFLTGGAIDLVLAKPVPRWLVFLIKYVGSLLFVVLQVTVFCLAAFLILRFRLGEWRWPVFMAVPIVSLMFSYLYGIMVLLNVLTRSTLASLLVTILTWMALASVQIAEQTLNQFRLPLRQEAAEYTELSGIRQGRLDQAREADDAAQIENWTRLLEKANAERDKAQRVLDRMEPWYKAVHAAVIVLPKTGETIDLLGRWMDSDSEINFTNLMFGGPEALDETAAEFDAAQDPESTDRERMELLNEEYRGRSVAFVIGTSLAFEAVVVGMAMFLFVRRDF